MKIFFVSSSFVENSLIYNLDYLTDRNITEIVLLQENHTASEHQKCLKYTITLCDTVLSATTICDAAIIIAPPNIQSRRYEMIYEYVKTRIQETYYIDLSTACYDKIYKTIPYSADIPTVLILALGKFHQVQNLELSLNELFSLKEVAFNQFFSPMTAIMIEEFRNKKLLNQNIINSIHASCFDIQITSLCYESFESAFNNMILLETVHKMSPSYVFVVSERNLQEKQEWIGIFQNRLNCQFNSILFSDYMSLLWDNAPTPILITNKFNPYLKSEKRESIWNAITKNIAFPEKLKVIRANR